LSGDFDLSSAWNSREYTVAATTNWSTWISAEELEEFNRHIRGEIRVIRKFSSQSDPTQG